MVENVAEETIVAHVEENQLVTVSYQPGKLSTAGHMALKSIVAKSVITRLQVTRMTQLKTKNGQ